MGGGGGLYGFMGNINGRGVVIVSVIMGHSFINFFFFFFFLPSLDKNTKFGPGVPSAARILGA